MQDLREKLAEIKEHIKAKASHPYLLKHVEAPDIDEDKLILLLSLLNQLDLSKAEIDRYALTITLIQIALDTHEHVTNSKALKDSSQNMQRRQLTVLAGDYYSGLYYKFLAEIDNISMIRTLAEGIKNINEHKITVYQRDTDGVDKLMNSIRKIESSLFEKISEYFHAGAWNEVASNLLLVKRLMAERKQFLQASPSIVFEILKKLTFPKHDCANHELSSEQQKYLLLVCDRYIEYARKLIENGLKKLPKINELLEERILFFFNEHQPTAKTYVEEG
ncbi:heptaprenyl diphosphate synthase [Bacillus canaveralius]|uniref:Heptaprenyl diphosphate synthase n=1 Tax=Bacillus canaveralius TaxID=1403243 RepID=A0A2N5GRU1_9BACI|nr:heptaprenyl diphosphate synthase [Bacillus sp. V33-4]PLR86166.1 heptaprenyl diphosphate synthase [Bacillus canaveralius]PLS00286.1 heptaprenyl diphosphate synthase [Bacillus canaveralius]RSK52088.1 heptaprenyl diphosphate synthase component 1 [Bacillus canaveralius]